uniref:Uncharacterized protein n=1 Tax=Guillardia theta TaxID=55529 RepID=A0A7S4JEE3_GUITH|mmetsp:Transcript_15689/g.52514  ORF Transcript_15689/g.52514 Transcript_15689/m.52514 type:complete len:363 (+) Transcript_15689:335-1423(+)
MKMKPSSVTSSSSTVGAEAKPRFWLWSCLPRCFFPKKPDTLVEATASLGFQGIGSTSFVDIENDPHNVKEEDGPLTKTFSTQASQVSSGTNRRSTFAGFRSLSLSEGGTRKKEDDVQENEGSPSLESNRDLQMCPFCGNVQAVADVCLSCNTEMKVDDETLIEIAGESQIPVWCLPPEAPVNLHKVDLDNEILHVCLGKTPFDEELDQRNSKSGERDATLQTCVEHYSLENIFSHSPSLLSSSSVQGWLGKEKEDMADATLKLSPSVRGPISPAFGMKYQHQIVSREMFRKSLQRSEKKFKDDDVYVRRRSSSKSLVEDTRRSSRQTEVGENIDEAWVGLSQGFKNLQSPDFIFKKLTGYQE